MADLIERQAAIETTLTFLVEYCGAAFDGDMQRMLKDRLDSLLSAQPEQHEIGYSECADAMLKMWIDNVLTDGEYNRIMDKLNAHWAERREE